MSFAFQIPCPGTELELDSNETEACRFLGLTDGTVINQSPVSKFLCSPEALNAIQLQMAIDYLDGVGRCSFGPFNRLPLAKYGSN